MATALVGAILSSGGRILLGLRHPDRRSFPHCWDIIGGHLESGEAPRDALDRESQEEIGVSADDAVPLASIHFEYPSDTAFDLAIFLVTTWTGTPAIRDEEHSELRWFDPAVAASIPNLALPHYRHIFASLA